MASESVSRLGWVCLALVTVMLALSIPLHGFDRALPVAAVSAVAGAGLGVALAMITRTRHPALIYLWLAAGGATFYPLMTAWPAADSFDLTLWRGAPGIVANYFDLLRGGVFLLAIAYPFARFGRHRPDEPAPNDSPSKTPISSETGDELTRH